MCVCVCQKLRDITAYHDVMAYVKRWNKRTADTNFFSPYLRTSYTPHNDFAAQNNLNIKIRGIWKISSYFCASILYSVFVKKKYIYVYKYRTDTIIIVRLTTPPVWRLRKWRDDHFSLLKHSFAKQKTILLKKIWKFLAWGGIWNVRTVPGNFVEHIICYSRISTKSLVGSKRSGLGIT